ncbi:MAG: hypothetical protein IPL39_19800 [Opitutaceae bacterium]|nr:hypothetical protein [Opitutaceae bacterium]
MQPSLPLLCFLLALPALALAQGSLTPPGAPAPTMKTLDQVEARIPLPAGARTTPIMIAGPGSYYLTGDIMVDHDAAIMIVGRNVTLDLNGYTISTTCTDDPKRGFGIVVVSGSVDVTIRNGRIRGEITRQPDATYTGAGFQFGIYAGWETGKESNPVGVTVEDVAVDGARYFGIMINGADGRIRHCSVSHCGFEGLRATSVSDSVATDCGTAGIIAQEVTRSRGTGITYQGIRAQTVVDSYGQSTSAHGIEAEVVIGSQGESVSGCGIRSTIATSCHGSSTDSNGIQAFSVAHCYGYSMNGYGLYASAASNSGGATGTGPYGLIAVYNAENCTGYSNSGGGLYAENATNCAGTSLNGTRGLSASQTATGCSGRIYRVAGADANRLDPAQPRALSAGIATNCIGTVDSSSGTSFGLFAGSATNCRGLVTTNQDSNPDRPACGLHAEQSASDSYGNCPTGYGLEAGNAANCTGESQSGTGLSAGNASNCTGQTNSGSYGLNASGNATNCTGFNTTGAYGLNAGGTASFCSGGRPSGTALQASIAVACTAISGSITSPSKQLGTP